MGDGYRHHEDGSLMHAEDGTLVPSRWSAFWDSWAGAAINGLVGIAIALVILAGLWFGFAKAVDLLFDDPGYSQTDDPGAGAPPPYDSAPH
jgi:hypothetical protein